MIALDGFLQRVARIPLSARLIWLYAAATLIPVIILLLAAIASLPADSIAAFEDERARLAVTSGEAGNRIQALEARARANPRDGEAWLALGRAQLSFNETRAAVGAFSRAVDVTNRSAEAVAALAEAQVFAAQGRVTQEAERLFAEVAAADPTDTASLYYIGLAASQRGDSPAALGFWRRLVAASPPDAPWLPPLAEQVRDLAVKDRKPPQDYLREVGLVRTADLQPGAAPPDIGAMVGSLEARLMSEGGSADEWIMLVRSLKVLGEAQRLDAAAAAARGALQADPAALAAIDAMTAQP